MRTTGTSRVRAALALAAAGAVTLAVTAALSPAASAAPVAGAVSGPFGHSGLSLTDPQGRAVVLHGLNQVYKVPPYAPSTPGFGADDAQFLQDNGFDAMRIGVIWAAVEPSPGVYDDAYLDSIAATVDTLAAHGIVSLLDFHQDLYNERFQGEGAPAWAVHDLGLPNPALGFPWNYFGNLAEDHAWDAFWLNLKAPDGVGLQDHYAGAWRHVAQRFAARPDVVGYEVINEPWPGTLWEQCLAPVISCPVFESTMTRFYRKVVSAIRTADPTTTVWIEPNVLNAQVDSSAVGDIADANIGWSFHDYCSTAEIGLGTAPCPLLDQLTIGGNRAYANSHGLPWLLTEFGATRDVVNLSSVVQLADRNRLGWLEWAYSGNDKTSQDSAGQALVLDPALPPTGANVVSSTLHALAEPYPQLVAGTPSSWSFTGGVFSLSYSTVKAGAPLQRFPAGSETVIAAPALQFPAGYSVTVSGATVVSPPDAALLRVRSLPGATTVTVSVGPSG
ncbi:MAG: endoglycosylceramidase [Pseudonocardiales bacterium]|jgi:endoglycosylceramidase|nr:endoglycosylceramidase [Pseudonocardiales bacterium]